MPYYGQHGSASSSYGGGSSGSHRVNVGPSYSNNPPTSSAPKVVDFDKQPTREQKAMNSIKDYNRQYYSINPSSSSSNSSSASRSATNHPSSSSSNRQSSSTAHGGASGARRPSNYHSSTKYS